MFQHALCDNTKIKITFYKLSNISHHGKQDSFNKGVNLIEMPWEVLSSCYTCDSIVGHVVGLSVCMVGVRFTKSSFHLKLNFT